MKCISIYYNVAVLFLIVIAVSSCATLIRQNLNYGDQMIKSVNDFVAYIESQNQ